ncbi:MAG: 23S rRNA (adenine(2503)-C(2))-methyltransferase RlmN [Pseudomonadota bacterium]|nr:23S rRNA (adenine(2503)-C(2))-methyltransferase RlmN [Pseudomonadota bacterium]
MPRYPRADGRLDFKSLTLDEIEAEIAGLGSEKFRALTAYKWVWQRGARTFAEMKNIATPVRVAMDEKFYIGWLECEGVIESADGTTKFLWKTDDGYQIESVLIPDGDRLTLCVSSQVGCAMACTFCLTGDLGLKRHLRPSEIANQPLQIKAGLDTRITNVVMMGMGEPLHNFDNLVAALRTYLAEDALGFSHRKVTVSTVGLVPAMQKLAELLRVNLAVSLNATTEEQRRAVMPITRKHSMAELLEACRTLPIMQHKRITFEYVMMGGVNDSMDDAARLVDLMAGMKAKVNLIPYNENPSRDIRRPSDERVHDFQTFLVHRGVQCSVRSTRGIDISAACGQLGKADPRSATDWFSRNRTASPA